MCDFRGQDLLAGDFGADFGLLDDFVGAHQELVPGVIDVLPPRQPAADGEADTHQAVVVSGYHEYVLAFADDIQQLFRELVVSLQPEAHQSHARGAQLETLVLQYQLLEHLS